MTLRWTAYVAPKSSKGAQKRKMTVSVKNAIHLKKVCYEVSLCQYCQRQSCTAFTDLSICAKMVGGGCPLLCKNLVWNWPTPFKNADFQLLWLPCHFSQLAYPIQYILRPPKIWYSSAHPSLSTLRRKRPTLKLDGENMLTRQILYSFSTLHSTKRQWQVNGQSHSVIFESLLNHQ